MADTKGNPQLEDGHARIANELIDALCRTYLSPCESKVVWEVIRRTYGWQKKTDRMSYGQIAQDCLMDRVTAIRTVSRLKDRKILSHSDGSLGLNKHYENWKTPALVTKQPLADTKAEREVASDQTATSLVTKQPLADTQAEHDLASDQTATSPKCQAASDQTATSTSDQTATSLVTKQPLADAQGVVAKQPPTKDKYIKTTYKDKVKDRRKTMTTDQYPKWLQIISGVKTIPSDKVESFIQEVTNTFGHLNLEQEALRFKFYWEDGKRKLQRTRQAWFNWLVVADRKYKEQGQNNFAATPRGMPGNDSAGALEELEGLAEELDILANGGK